MKPEDIADLVEASDPRVSPDGRTIAFVVTAPDLADNRYRTAVWMAGLDGDLPPIPFTHGTARASKPRWSPDGSRLAYVSKPGERGAVLVVAEVEDGSTTDLLDWPEDIDDVVWTPDGRHLVVCARERDEAQYGPEKDRDRPPRRVDRLQYRLEPVGWTLDRPRHLFTIAADGSAGGRATALTSGPFADSSPAVSPDGRLVAFSSARTDTWDTDLSTHIYVVPFEGGDVRQLTGGTTSHGQPSWSADGARIAYVWGDRHSMSRHGQIGIVDVDLDRDGPDLGGDRLVTTSLDRNCAPYLALARDALWDASDSVLFQVDDAGNVAVYRAGLDGTCCEVVGGERQVTGFDQQAGTLAFTATTPTSPGDLHVVVDGEERRLTSHGDAFASAHDVALPERFTATSADGTEVEAWILRPPGLADGELCPAILNIHGGPFSQYGNRLFDEFQVQVGAGYAVIYSNPRGSSGYSEAFSRAIRGPKAEHDPGTGWGGADYDDLMAVVDEAVRRFPFVDADRLGVIGGSYGGYMTSWIAGHTDRFRAAVSERACNNLLTFAHTSDIGTHFPAGYIGATHLDDPDEFVRQSPTTYWRDIATPLLILHSENDLRCPIEQAEDLYVRLKMSGAEVEFVRFPGEGHELTRSGAPRHRAQRHSLILEWFARWLG